MDSKSLTTAFFPLPFYPPPTIHFLTTMPSIVLATLNAKYPHCAFGLRYLLANMGELRDETALLEFTINQQTLEILDAILAQRPRIVGLGVYIWNVDETTRLVADLKRVAPDVIVVLGGPEVSYETDQQEIARLADYVITGEGDLAFAALCRELLVPSPPSSGERVRVRGPSGDDALNLESIGLPSTSSVSRLSTLDSQPTKAPPHPSPLARRRGRGDEKRRTPHPNPLPAEPGRGDKQLPAQGRERQIGLAGDDVIGEPRDLLLIGLVTDFGSAEDHDHVGGDSLQIGHQSSRLGHVPDVNTQPHDARPLRQDRVQNLQRLLVDRELQQSRLVPQLTHVGQQTAQPERTMRVLGVQSGEDNGGHDEGSRFQ